MKHLLLAAGLLGLASCSGSTTEKPVAGKVLGRKAVAQVVAPPTYQLTKIAQSTNLLLTIASYTGVLLRDKKPVKWDYGLTARVITPAEVIQAEAILQRCASPEQVTWYWYKSGVDSLNGLRQQWANAIGPLRFYTRQYRGLRTADGQRVIWINAFPKEMPLNLSSPPTWQTAEVQVEDGGKAFFNIYVNLDKAQCFNFMRNSEG